MKSRTYFFFMPFFLALFSCKMPSNEGNPPANHKTHAVERTQWKYSAKTAGEPDLILDFYTNQHVQEYLVLSNGTKTKANHGTYKIKKRRIINIKWNEGKYFFENITGEIYKNKLTITEISNKKEYFKIKDY